MKRIKANMIKVQAMGVEVECYYVLDKGFRGSLEEPPEPAECLIWMYKIGGQEVDERHLRDKFVYAIQIAVEEEVWTEECVEEDMED